MSAADPAWLTPADLAAELRPDDLPATREQWVKRQMRTGAIPSIKIGRRRWFTPECRRQMEREQLGLAEQDAGWDRVTRGRRAS